MTLVDEPVIHDPRPWWRRLTVGKVLAGAFMLSMVVFWVWAFSPWKPDSNVDRLSTDAFADLARPVCQTMLDDLRAVGNAADVTTPQERADLLVLQNEVVAQFVTDLRALPRGGPDDAFLLESWFADWDLYLSDRERHVERLRTGDEDDDLRFRLTAIDGGRGVDARIDGFATANRMEECATPGDV
jgi:hypothetical protein